MPCLFESCVDGGECIAEGGGAEKGEQNSEVNDFDQVNENLKTYDGENLKSPRCHSSLLQKKVCSQTQNWNSPSLREKKKRQNRQKSIVNHNRERFEKRTTCH